MDSNGAVDEQLIFDEFSQPLCEGETWYLLDMRWMNTWKEYAGIGSAGSGQVKNGTGGPPGPIDNSALFQEKSGKLKTHLLEATEYELIPEESWSKLVDIYGLAEGQAPIGRKVIETGSFTKQTTVEIYPPEISLSMHGKEKNVKETFSRGVKLAEVHKKMREIFEVPDNRKTRVYIKDSNDAVEESRTLDMSGVGPTQTLVLEEQNGDGTWPRTSPPTYEAATSSTSSYSKKFNNYSSSSSSSSTYMNGAYGTRSATSSYYSRDDGEPGLCGLSNLGNTCFMNSAIQCLSNVPSLTMYFQKKKYVDELNTVNPLGMHGKLAKAYAGLIHEIWSGHHSSVSPREFKYMVSGYAPQFSGYQQHDSQELMAFLVDGLHEDLNRIEKKPYIELKDSNGRPDGVVALEAWKNHLQRNDSVVVDTFHGLFKSTLVCPDCNRVSITFDPFGFLSLPLPGVKEVIVTCHFVSRKREAPVVKYCLSVPKSGCIRDVSKALAEKTDSYASDLMVTDVYNYRFYKVYKGTERVSGYSDRDNLFVFELGSDDGQENANGPEYAKVFMRQGTGGSGMRLFGHPLLVPVRSGVTTYRKFYNAVLSAVWRYIKKESIDDVKMLSELQKCGINESIDEDGNGEDGVPRKQERIEELQLFRLVLINTFGTTVLKDLEDDDKPIRFSTDVCFAAEWDKKVCEEYCVDDWQSTFKDDPSVSMNPRKDKTISLQDCMTLFTTEERLGEHDLWYCPNCKEHKQATKKFDLWALPPVLIIHLKRFSYNRWSRDKISTFVEFPSHDLDLSEFVINPEKSKWQKELKMYNLIGVSNHYGGMGGGHYTAYARNYLNNKWYYFDDSSVTLSSEDKVQTKAAYMLMYQRQDLEQWVEHGGQEEFPFLESLVSPRNFGQGFTYENEPNGNLRQKTYHNGNENRSDHELSDMDTS